MDAMIVKVGNSRGIRIPKPLIEQAGLGERVKLTVVAGGLLIEPRDKVRAGWAEAAQHSRDVEDTSESDERWPQTRFDAIEWEWELSGMED